MKLMGSNTPVVKSLSELAHGNTQSVISTNQKFIEALRREESDDDVHRIAAQIQELNQCLDGQAHCGLDKDQIKDIIDYVSTL